MLHLNKRISARTKNLFRNYSFMIGSYFLFFFLIGFLNSVLPSIDLEKYQQTELFDLMEERPWIFAFLAVVIAPVLEESIFRSLIKPSLTEIYIFCCAILCFISLGFLSQETTSLVKYALVGLSAFILFLFLQSLEPSRLIRKLRFLLYRNYKLIWFLTAFLFGLVHIWNYVEGWEFNLILFLLIFPRVIAGYFFGKIKIENNGLIWAIAMHAMNNGIVLLLVLPRLL